MAASLQNPRSSARSRHRPLSEINVTPFVDVMLVLLIIFMVTAPLMTVGVPVELPKTKAKALSDSIEPLVVSINKEGTLFLQDTEVPLEELVVKIQAILEGKPDTRVFVRGDTNLTYGRIVEVMGTLTAAGIEKVALMAQLPKKSAPKNKGK